MRNGGPPARGCVTSAESTTRLHRRRRSAVRCAMSLMENCTIPSRTPLRMAFCTALWIWSSSPISVKMPRRRPRVDLPAQRHVHLHPHLLAGERVHRLRLVAALRELLLAGRVALDRGPRRHEADAGQERLLRSTVPKACSTPTSPGSITTAADPTSTSTPTVNSVRASILRTVPAEPFAPCARSAALVVQSTTATRRRSPPKISLPIWDLGTM